MNQSYTSRVSIKKVFYVFFIFLSCFIISSSVLAQGSLDEGLVAHWTMNQTDYSGSTLLDKTTNANNLTNYSATFTTDRAGTSNRAMNFGARTNTYYLSIANNSSLQIVGNQTISMWLKPADLSAGRQNPYAKAYGGEGTITQETTGRLNYYYGTAGSNTTPYQAFSMTNALDNNVWAHVVLVRDLTNMRLKWYKNGILTNETTASYSSATASTLPVEIGRGYAGNYAGLIDDIRVYNRALSDREIAILFNEGICASDICQAFENREVVLQVHGDSLKVNNTGRSTFVPAKSLTEWSEFKLHYPSHITISATTAAGCALPWGGVINHGQSVTAYQSPGENCGPTCVSETRTCSNGVLSGSYQYRACISTCTCALPWGGTINNGESITAYSIDIAVPPETCLSEVRNCSVGVLSGSYQYSSCSICETSVVYEGESYATKKIGSQCWFARDLNVGTFLNSSTYMSDNGIIEKYCYNNNTSNCNTRGGLYMWAELLNYSGGGSNQQGICPDGWHVPTDAEWHTLEFLLATGSCPPDRQLTDGLLCSPAPSELQSLGFNIVYGGQLNHSRAFSSWGSYSSYWMANSGTSGIERNIASSGISRSSARSKTNIAYSARCIKN